MTKFDIVLDTIRCHTIYLHALKSLRYIYMHPKAHGCHLTLPHRNRNRKKIRKRTTNKNWHSSEETIRVMVCGDGWWWWVLFGVLTLVGWQKWHPSWEEFVPPATPKILFWETWPAWNDWMWQVRACHVTLVLQDVLHWLCRYLSGYSLKLHFLHSAVSEVPVLHISSTSAYRRRISVAEPVSVLQNVEIWAVLRTATELSSALPLQSSEQSCETFVLIFHLQSTVSAWIENPSLTAGLQPLRTLCWRVYWTELFSPEEGRELSHNVLVSLKFSAQQIFFTGYRYQAWEPLHNTTTTTITNTSVSWSFFQDNLGKRHHKGKPFWIHWSKRRWDSIGIGKTICKSFAPRSRQITTPLPHHSVFTGQMPFLPPNQQRQSTEGRATA